jgi:predicted SAM-dependent methyltransferase
MTTKLLDRLFKIPLKARLYSRIRKQTPRSWKVFLSRNFFGLLSVEAAKKDIEAIGHNRLVLAARYIKGSGIEIGALGRPCPVPPDVKVKYLDRFDDKGLLTDFPEIDYKIKRPDIIDSAETMETVADNSQDFVIANHVIEHLPNPLSFIKNAVRVVKSGGVLYIGIPNKDVTFDHSRPITTFEHLMSDYKNGPAASRMGHNHNAAQAWKTEEECQALIKKLEKEDYSIHYHVWDTWAMLEMFMKAKEAFNLPIKLEASVVTKDDALFILRKQ